MHIIYKYDNKKAGEIANSLARERGYYDYGSIDDPGLREWIWNRAVPHVRVHRNLVVSPLVLFTPATIFLVIGFLLGMVL